MGRGKDDQSMYDTCPICGERKTKVSRTCSKCRFQETKRFKEINKGIQWDLLTPEWLSEFRGFFWGEGSCFLSRNKTTISAKIRVNLRFDDIAVLQDIQSKLGGTLIYNDRQYARDAGGKAYPQVGWQVTAIPHVYEVCKLLHTGAMLPAKKREDVALVMEYCEWRIPRLGYVMTDKERQEIDRFYVRWSELRVVKEQTG